MKLTALVAGAFASAAASLVSFAPTANATTYTYDMLFDIATDTITGEITTNCDNCGLSPSNILSWAFYSSSGPYAVSSTTPGANMTFSGSSVLIATSWDLNFTVSVSGLISFNGPPGTMAVQFTTNNPTYYPECTTITKGCEIAILPTGTIKAYLNEDQQVGLLTDPSPTPLPAALPLFATGLGALGLLGWRRKRKGAAFA